MMTITTIKELKRLEAEATPGPWELGQTVIHGTPYGGKWVEISDKDNLIPISGSGGAMSYTRDVINDQRHDYNDANAALIVAMRNALPELLKALEESQAENASLRRVNKALGNMLEPRGGVDVG